MRVTTVVAVLVAVSAIPAGLAAGAASPETVVAAVQLEAEEGSTARGVAYFRQRGDLLSGWVAVWGLGPGTRHAVHFHGPAGACAGPARDAVAVHPDLVADRRGVAHTTFSVRVKGLVLKKGVYYNVHAGSAAAGKTASLVCGDVKPERLR